MVAPWKKSYDKPRQHIKKQTLHFSNKGPYSQSYSFCSSHVWMWGLDHKEGWTLKNWCFRIVVLENSWEFLGQQGSSQSILKELNPEYSLEGLMLKLKLNLQCFGHLMWRPDSLEKTWMLGKIECRRRRRWQGMRWLDDVIDSMDMSLSKLQKIVKDRDAWHAAVHGIAKNQTQFSDWTKDCGMVCLCVLCYMSLLLCSITC